MIVEKFFLKALEKKQEITSATTPFHVIFLPRPTFRCPAVISLEQSPASAFMSFPGDSDM
jgi:hypothetical protein